MRQRIEDQQQDRAGVVHATLRGDVTAPQVHSLKEDLLGLLVGRVRLELDLRAVTHMDDGAGALLASTLELLDDRTWSQALVGGGAPVLRLLDEQDAFGRAPRAYVVEAPRPAGFGATESVLALSRAASVGRSAQAALALATDVMWRRSRTAGRGPLRLRGRDEVIALLDRQFPGGRLEHTIEVQGMVLTGARGRDRRCAAVCAGHVFWVAGGQVAVAAERGPRAQLGLAD